MRIGIDAHILLRQHKRYSEKIARYTEEMITALLGADTGNKHTWVLFFDGKLADRRQLDMFLKTLNRPNVEVKTFPFLQYRRYLPVLYSHMLMASFLRSARLDVFHSPEGLIPIAYRGKIVATFHYVPRGKLESNLFVRTFMLGARVAFAQMCRQATRIVVESEVDQEMMVKRWGYPKERLLLLSSDMTWDERAEALLKMYEGLARKDTSKNKVTRKKRKAKTEK